MSAIFGNEKEGFGGKSNFCCHNTEYSEALVIPKFVFPVSSQSKVSLTGTYMCMLTLTALDAYSNELV